MSEESSIDQNDLNHFREMVMEFMSLPEIIKTEEEPIKQKKARLKELELGIQTFMKERDYNHIEVPEEVGGGLLMVTPSSTKTTIKKDNWSKGFSAFCAKRGIEDVTFEEFESEVQNTRDTVVKNVLKRKRS